MNTERVDLEELKRLAEAATPGPWTSNDIRTVGEPSVVMQNYGIDGFTLPAGAMLQGNPFTGSASRIWADAIISAQEVQP